MLRSSALGVAIAIAVMSPVARADEPAPAEKPWAVGVSAESKAAAQQHLEAGNALFLERKYSAALDEYKQALEAWKHPAIRFNMVRCLIFLERPLEASEHLKLALQYGAAPFDETIYSEALGYEKLLASEIGELDIGCQQPGVQLTMDGTPLLACPGKEQRRVLPGHHQIVGKKDGFVPNTVEVWVLGGKHEHAELELKPLSQAARIEHRWRTWIPWAVFGGGFAVAGIGGLVHLKATSDNSTYANLVTQQCPDGCTSGMLDHSLQTSARVENGVAIGLLAVGAAGVAAGSVMLYLNRGRTVYDIPEGPGGHITRIDVVPTRDGAAFAVAGRF